MTGVLSPAGPRGERGALRRLLIDNDWAGDPDGLVALAHHLLSTDRVDAITSSLTSPLFPGSDSGAKRGAELVELLLQAVDPLIKPAVEAGSETPGNASTGEPSPAAHLIVEHALREDDLPLTVVCAGPLTNVAQALDEEPVVARRARLVWVGGSIADVFEYNRDVDPVAAERVFGSEMKIEQFPLEAYRRCTYSLAELEVDLAGSAIGEVLWEAFAGLPLPTEAEVGEVWHLGDSLPLLATSLSPSTTPSNEQRIVHTEVDFRLLVGDMRAKFAMHERSRRASRLGELHRD